MKPLARWQVVALVLAAGAPALLTLGPPLDLDTWWHLAVGRWVVENGRLPEYDPFSRMSQESPVPWVAYSWLYELGLYGCHAAAGRVGVLVARTVLCAASVAALFGLLFARAGVNARSLAVAAALGVGVTSLMQERPWHFTIVGTALTVVAAERLRAGGRPYWLPLVFVVWANTHVQFVTGWMVLGLAVLFPGAGGRARAAGLLAACVAAVAVNPYHVRLFGVIAEYAGQSGGAAVSVESMPPRPTDVRVWVLGAAGAYAVASLARRRPAPWFHLALLAAGAYLALRMSRDRWVLALAVAAAGPGWRPGTDLRAAAWPAAWVVAATFAGMRVLGLAGGGAGSAQADAPYFPVRAAEFVRERRPPGPLFNSMRWGGYLIWALPEYPVAVDGRTNLYGSRQIVRDSLTWYDPRDDWPSDPVLKASNLLIAQQGEPLTEALAARGREWCLIYRDGTAAVFQRRRGGEPCPKDVIGGG